MELNSDFSQRAVVHGAQIPWLASPMAGVERRMLDRIGDEVARATTIVRYAAGSHFSSHVHTGGEEFLVLEGVFQDEHGDFPVGSYVRNPPQSSHTPGSELGCVIFVKLWQFDLDDRKHVRLDTNAMEFDIDQNNPAVGVMPLFQDAHEEVFLEQWQAGAEVDLTSDNGLELLVVAGSFKEANEDFSPQSWLRLPKNSVSTAIAGPAGARVWIKRNHLEETPKPPGS